MIVKSNAGDSPGDAETRLKETMPKMLDAGISRFAWSLSPDELVVGSANGHVLKVKAMNNELFLEIV